ncbi:glycosyltransferase [Candidatus Peribacteria bacterium]|nr:glycosyltransferase [Candidatus Peribacteria bacterium]
MGLLVLQGGLWYAHRAPVSPPAMPEKLPCVSYDPHYALRGYNPQHDQAVISPQQLERDMAFLQRITSCVRVYSSTGGLQRLPRIAQQYGMNVIVGAWIDPQYPERTRQEIDNALWMANNNSNVPQVILGNEVLFFEQYTVPELIAILDDARSRTQVPLSTAEMPFNWEWHPELVAHVDFLTIHAFSYWAGEPSSHSIAPLAADYKKVQRVAGGKRIFFGEVGWPSAGYQQGQAQPGVQQQGRFLREFAHRAAQEGWWYNVIEAYDQPWKLRTQEGRTGAHFGLFTPSGQMKWPWSGPLERLPHWEWWAGLSLLLSAWWSVLLWERRHPGGWGVELFLHGSGHVFAVVLVLVGYTLHSEYLLRLPIIWGFLVVPLLFLALVVVAKARESAPVLRRVPLLQVPVPVPLPLDPPLVSLHLPTHNEPPEVVIATLRALTRLEYPRFEVRVLDNNTRDTALWEPVQQYITALQDQRFHFHHSEEITGYKAGALNWGISLTPPEYSLIACIDADYQVQPGWLGQVVGYFSDPQVAAVQCPQHHQSPHMTPQQRAMCAEYEAFFHIGMVRRNEDNAIVLHGTMVCLRRSVLEGIGWPTHTITEDADLGLQLLMAGHRVLYHNAVLGSGVPPVDFSAYEQQRFR